MYEGKHEAIISEEDWNLAQEKRKVNAYRREKVNDPTHAHILSGILKCPCCGKSLYGNIAKAHSKDKKTRYYYYCKNTVTPTGHECTFRLNIEQTEMNRMVASIISAMVSDPRFADAIKAKIGSAVDTNDLEKQLEALQAQLRQTLGTKTRLERQMDGLDVNDPYYDRKISDLQRRYDEQYGVIRKLAAYVILGINTEGKKEVLSINVGDNESAKYWLSVLNELKNRGVRDILILCADGLTGIKEAIAAAFPKTEYQRCIVHQVRNTLKYVPDKDRKAFATDLKTIYHASDESKAREALERVNEKWSPKYPNSMKRWYDNWDAVSPIFKFSAAVRKVIYTTNSIESLNATYRKLNRQRSVFPSDTALLKALYLSTFEATKKWTTTIRNWAQVYGELSIMYEGRLPE